MSIRSVELWRPRREPKHRARRMLAGMLALAALVGSPAAAMITRRPVVLWAGFAATIVLTCGWLWLSGRGATWAATRPRPWVPRVARDLRGAPGPDRRARARAWPAPAPVTPPPCNTQPAERRVAIGDGPPV